LELFWREMLVYSFDQVSFKYTDYIIKDFSLTIKHKKIGIIGENGVGKTTLLKLMSGQLTPQNGNISIHGDPYFVQFDLSKYHKFTPQDMIDLCRPLKSFDCTRYLEYVRTLNLSSYMDTPIGNLSKGTAKKVALMLGFISVQPVLLIDEPFESLDQTSKENIVRLFKEEARGLVIVSHEIDFLKQSVERIYHMKNKGLKLSEC